MKVFIETQKLDTTYGLVIEPFHQLDAVDDDSTFLQNLIIDTKPKKIRKSNNLIVQIGGLDKCITKEDVDYMILQKNKNINFLWDSTRLPFTSTYKYPEKYIFSVPLFSLDSTKVLISYENQMGTGRVVLLKKEKNVWTSQSTLGWIH